MIATIETSNSIRLHHLLPDKAFIEDMKSAFQIYFTPIEPSTSVKLGAGY
jgi:hypothetical protein